MEDDKKYNRSTLILLTLLAPGLGHYMIGRLIAAALIVLISFGISCYMIYLVYLLLFYLVSPSEWSLLISSREFFFKDHIWSGYFYKLGFSILAFLVVIVYALIDIWFFSKKIK